MAAIIAATPGSRHLLTAFFLERRLQHVVDPARGRFRAASGLTFIAAAQDDFLRACDTRSGELLWEARLPAGGQASPLTCIQDGRQCVAIAAGGHARLRTALGDSVVVYALPR